jgi:putative intracellular protease/amidase
MRIAIALFDGAEELDWAGPWEVLAAWAHQFPNDGVEVYTVAESLEPVSCAKGLRVLADYTWETAPRPDVVVYPGGRGTQRELQDERVLARLRGLAQVGVLMTSVCTGSLVYAAAGPRRRGGVRSRSSASSAPTRGQRPASLTTATSSRLRASPPGSTWPCTSWLGFIRWNARATSGDTSSTTPSRRCESIRVAE